MQHYSNYGQIIDLRQAGNGNGPGLLTVGSQTRKPILWTGALAVGGALAGAAWKGGRGALIGVLLGAGIGWLGSAFVLLQDAQEAKVCEENPDCLVRPGMLHGSEFLRKYAIGFGLVGAVEVGIAIYMMRKRRR